MPAWLRWVLGIAVVLIVAGGPLALYRAEYAHAKRLREVTAGRFYRSGQMTAAGFRETFEKYHIKTVINLQHENPDPLVPENWLGKPTVHESEVCEKAGVKYFLLTPDILPEPNSVDKEPPVVEEFRKILDDPSNYPVLIHCKAGLHRTGRLTAIYRMEYEDWSVGAAVRELRANGFGYSATSEADPYVVQFVQNYKPRPKKPSAAANQTPAKETPAENRGGLLSPSPRWGEGRGEGPAVAGGRDINPSPPTPFPSGERGENGRGVNTAGAGAAKAKSRVGEHTDLKAGGQ